MKYCKCKKAHFDTKNGRLFCKKCRRYLKIKARKTWKRNPKTQIKKSDKKYKRNRDKKIKKEDFDE